ncbi:hypothetical protein KIN20_000131 [Parelaphostrongylus tenuis]|uniref:Uncharacterized protein n=1 Tax=Parelaphostrongylus tenuis TaxID=148309 RepID=A0AAD5QFU6_PARTN|nr:hypothetical protein KIN20_000131 [Parelaphostrongylus tenuis]
MDGTDVHFPKSVAYNKEWSVSRDQCKRIISIPPSVNFEMLDETVSESSIKSCEKVAVIKTYAYEGHYVYAKDDEEPIIIDAELYCE